ncbi:MULTISPECIES: PDZ domain-containing protein [Rheinheimera]|uniref:PDZ domain-containing protein n=1 Tax=Rheinheimera TaxID=67575 RepID=UPI001E5BFBA2|nr:PDZ domain-containing protein [Rheinheimera sp.]HJS15077.1 PDZ domain-containing protein [Rheinheimera sp.]
MNKKMLLLSAAFYSLVVSPTTLAAEKGKMGLALDIAVEGGFFNPTLSSVKVKELVAGGAAEKAGVLVGDQILKIADCVIPGCPADDAKDLMKKNKGESVSFLIKQADGTELTKTVVAE